MVIIGQKRGYKGPKKGVFWGYLRGPETRHLGHYSYGYRGLTGVSGGVQKGAIKGLKKG